MNIADTARKYAEAWSSGDPDAVASHYAENGSITINRGDPIEGRKAVSEMAAGFYAEFPDLIVLLDHLRVAGNHVMFGWTLEGTHSGTGQKVRVPGWEEWDLDAEGKVAESRGWFDAGEYERQIAEGI
ncbi:ester cyclase [Leisingera caerulea]|uniref:SgcJ/EcaC family oxidoreductase n=1 Tax=Leisingera caerulea TaxID=506591 RepID=UPI0004886886|nr:SgcJ/EcaC family oxidoreductase [Leisingera caerulea]UWQ49599.1 ester cyclase [Leisingera caerulea]